MDADVIVVGGGVMGLATAWRLASDGVDVVLFERFENGHGRGSSHGPTRIFRFLYHDLLYVRMAQVTLPMWRDLESETSTALLNMTGGVQIDDPEVLEMHSRAMTSCDAACEPVDPAAMRARFPWISGGDDPAIFVPDIGVLAADATLRALREKPDVRQATVEAIEPGDGVTVSTSDGSLRAHACVVAAGAWAPKLLEPIGIDIPVKVTREQVLYYDHVDGMLPFVHGRGHWVYGVPPFEPGGAMKVAEHGTGPEIDPDERTFDLDEERANRLRDYVSDYVPGLEREVGFDTCLYTSTPDSDFVIDRRGPVVFVSACSGHGFKFAPLVGDIAAALATDRPVPIDIARFSLDRFS